MTPRSQARHPQPAPLSPHFASHSAATIRQPSAAATSPSSKKVARATTSLQQPTAAPGVPSRSGMPAPPVSALSMMGGGMGLGHGPALTSGAGAYRPFSPMQFYNYAARVSGNAAAVTSPATTFAFPSHQQHKSLATVSTSNSRHGSPRAPQVPSMSTPTPVVLLLTTPMTPAATAVAGPAASAPPPSQSSPPSALQYYAGSAVSSGHLQALQQQLQQQQASTSGATAAIDVKDVNTLSVRGLPVAATAVAPLDSVSPPTPRAPRHLPNGVGMPTRASSPSHRQVRAQIGSAVIEHSNIEYSHFHRRLVDRRKACIQFLSSLNVRFVALIYRSRPLLTTFQACITYAYGNESSSDECKSKNVRA